MRVRLRFLRSKAERATSGDRQHRILDHVQSWVPAAVRGSDARLKDREFRATRALRDVFCAKGTFVDTREKTFARVRIAIPSLNGSSALRIITASLPSASASMPFSSAIA
jgi:hypothetical protein